PYALEPLVLARRLVVAPRLPVALQTFSTVLDDQQRSRLEPVHTAHAGARARDVLECEVRVERGEVGLHAEARQSVKRLQLRCERERPVGQARPDERLLAEPVAREQ